MSDIDLYEKSPESYEEIQNSRPDYIASLEAMRELTRKYIGNKRVLLADFCCGTGKNTRLLIGDIDIQKAVLIDINESFIRTIEETFKDDKRFIFIKSDILTAQFTHNFDVVLSMFAYHHVRDVEKEKYVQQVVDALKEGSILILGEIYVPNKETGIKYYEKLLNEIGNSNKKSEIEKFLRQTARSETFEFKVSKQFADLQLTEKGFELLESRKIWPKDNELGEDVGMYVEAWKLSRPLGVS